MYLLAVQAVARKAVCNRADNYGRFGNERIKSESQSGFTFLYQCGILRADIRLAVSDDKTSEDNYNYKRKDTFKQHQKTDYYSPNNNCDSKKIYRFFSFSQ